METFGWPMGPAFLLDVIGLDTIAHIVDIICDGFPDRLRLDCTNAAAVMVANRRLGQKNGLGFYRYEADPKGRPHKLKADDIGAIMAELQPSGTKPFTDAEIVERMMLAMIVEAAHCLEDAIVDTAIEVDMALVLGLGFPRHAGGALKYADWLGLDKVVAACDRYAAISQIFRPTAHMRQLAASDGKFYET